MTAGGHSRGRKGIRFSRNGFTLFEIVITLGMIGLLTTVFVINIDGMLRRGELDTLKDQFWEAVREAKESAVYNRKPYVLSYSKADKAFVVSSGESRTLFEIDTEALGDDIKIEVLFSEQYAENSFKLIGGRLMTSRDATRVAFYPDGTCTPFTAELTIAEYSAIINIDPWTGAELVEREKS